MILFPFLILSVVLVSIILASMMGYIWIKCDQVSKKEIFSGILYSIICISTLYIEVLNHFLNFIFLSFILPAIFYLVFKTTKNTRIQFIYKTLLFGIIFNTIFGIFIIGYTVLFN